MRWPNVNNSHLFLLSGLKQNSDYVTCRYRREKRRFRDVTPRGDFSSLILTLLLSNITSATKLTGSARRSSVLLHDDPNGPIRCSPRYRVHTDRDQMSAVPDARSKRAREDPRAGSGGGADTAASAARPPHAVTGPDHAAYQTVRIMYTLVRSATVSLII